MYLYYNTLFEKKQPFFVRKFKFLILFSCFRYNSLIFAQENMSIFVNFLSPLVIDKIAHTRCRNTGIRDHYSAGITFLTRKCVRFRIAIARCRTAAN